MGFDLCNYSLNIQNSIRTLTPKVRAHLGVWGFIPSHSPTFLGAWNVTPGLPTWLAPSQTFALVVSARLGLGHLYTKIWIISTCVGYHETKNLEVTPWSILNPMNIHLNISFRNIRNLLKHIKNHKE